MPPAPVMLIVAGVGVVAGYVVGSIPLARHVARGAGVDPAATGDDPTTDPAFATVWRLAGPGAGLLAFTGDLAKGVIPVTIGIVTFGWWIGWAAGVGAVLGAGWPAFRRRRGEGSVAVLGGVAFALAPTAGVVGLALGLVVLGVGRLTGRDAWPAAIVTGYGTFALAFAVFEPDGARVAGLVALFLVTVVRQLTGATAHHTSRRDAP